MAVLETNRQCIRLLKQIADNLEAEKDSLMRIAISKLEKLVEKEEKYGWHKADDLPKKDGTYWVHGKWTSGKEQEGECEFKVEDGYFDTQWNFSVIAWKEVEPYREEKK